MSQASATTVDAMGYLLAALRKLDFRALDEARQQPGVTYADRVSVAAQIEGLYPPADGFSAHSAEYAALMDRLDKITGTTGTYPRWSQRSIGGAA